MQETKVEIKILKDDLKDRVDPTALDNVIFVEDRRTLYTVSQIVLSGKYSRTYNIVSDFLELTPSRVLVDENILLICLFSELAVVDLEQNKLLRVIDFVGYELFAIYKFKSGYFIHGEGENRFLNSNFDVVWEAGGVDIFFNSKVEKDLEIHDDYIVAYDWCGYKYYYNESGEFKHEYYPQYNMSD